MAGLDPVPEERGGGGSKIIPPRGLDGSTGISSSSLARAPEPVDQILGGIFEPQVDSIKLSRVLFQMNGRRRLELACHQPASQPPEPVQLRQSQIVGHTSHPSML